jgi:uncharacterized protein YggE
MLMFLAAALAGAATPSTPPTIVVQGMGSVKSAPNVAFLSYNVAGEGKTSDGAVAALASKSIAVEKALRSMDPGLELHSESVSVQGVRGSDCKINRYDDDPALLSTGPCAIQGYVASQDFDIRTSLVSDAGTMVGLASREGATDPKIDKFAIADQREPKRQAIAAALADARAKAQAIADASNARLGEIKSVNLDNAYTRTEDLIVTGSREVQANRVPAPPPIVVTVKPSPVDTTAQVSVAYSIVQ